MSDALRLQLMANLKDMTYFLIKVDYFHILFQIGKMMTPFQIGTLIPQKKSSVKIKRCHLLVFLETAMEPLHQK